MNKKNIDVNFRVSSSLKLSIFILRLHITLENLGTFGTCHQHKEIPSNQYLILLGLYWIRVRHINDILSGFKRFLLLFLDTNQIYQIKGF